MPEDRSLRDLKVPAYFSISTVYRQPAMANYWSFNPDIWGDTYFRLNFLNKHIFELVFTKLKHSKSCRLHVHQCNSVAPWRTSPVGTLRQSE